MAESIYESLGVRTVIDAWGTVTALGGSLMAPEVLQAMQSAAGAFVDMSELHTAAGRRIADLLGVEACCVTCGAAAGLERGRMGCLLLTAIRKMFEKCHRPRFRNCKFWIICVGEQFTGSPAIDSFHGQGNRFHCFDHVFTILRGCAGHAHIQPRPCLNGLPFVRQDGKGGHYFGKSLQLFRRQLPVPVALILNKPRHIRENGSQRKFIPLAGSREIKL